MDSQGPYAYVKSFHYSLAIQILAVTFRFTKLLNFVKVLILFSSLLNLLILETLSCALRLHTDLCIWYLLTFSIYFCLCAASVCLLYLVFASHFIHKVIISTSHQTTSILNKHFIHQTSSILTFYHSHQTFYSPKSKSIFTFYHSYQTF